MPSFIWWDIVFFLFDSTFFDFCSASLYCIMLSHILSTCGKFCGICFIFGKSSPAMRLHYILRERSFLILGTRAEDNFSLLEKISYPILNTKKVFRVPSSFRKIVAYPIQKSLCIIHGYMDRYQVVHGDFHMCWSSH